VSLSAEALLAFAHKMRSVMRPLVRKSLRRALEFPTRQLANNAGQAGALIVQEIKKRSGNEGFNVAIGKYEDLVKAGVVDPAKVVRTALQNAARSPLSCSPQKHW
jgi:chaperonin GroEL (HSP60 family)